MTLKVALDLDGVLAEPLVGFFKFYKKKYNVNLTLEQVTDWNFFVKLGLSRKKFLDILDEVWVIWESVPLTEPNVPLILKNLVKSGAIVFDIVTCRSQKTIPFVEKWLKKFLIPYDSLVRANSVDEKVSLGYDVYVDDSPRLMELIDSDGGHSKAIMYVRPWHTLSVTESYNNVSLAESWKEISELLKSSV